MSAAATGGLKIESATFLHPAQQTPARDELSACPRDPRGRRAEGGRWAGEWGAALCPGAGVWGQQPCSPGRVGLALAAKCYFLQGALEASCGPVGQQQPWPWPCLAACRRSPGHREASVSEQPPRSELEIRFLKTPSTLCLRVSHHLLPPTWAVLDPPPTRRSPCSCMSATGGAASGGASESALSQG